MKRGVHSILCLFSSAENDLQWALTGVYELGEGTAREALLEDLSKAREGWDCPWMVGCDFNTVLYSNERSRCIYDSRCMRGFRKLVAELSMVDLPLIGGRYT